MEVLVRLRDESGEQLAPIDFVRAAERYRLMGPMDRWVVPTPLTVSVIAVGGLIGAPEFVQSTPVSEPVAVKLNASVANVMPLAKFGSNGLGKAVIVSPD